ncbi:ABC transporter permease [Halalkalibacter sp. APA_J-10(15)]|uniref:ABC transporter permease n=1 Tax=Halalkalibacter sp. APA_J-10(15) TaxID=2933805 RepID=UPI001FF5CA18|nr:ABC transporter permease [Halalkalibacter sp. APA_J-10(15)]MCK0471159.1 ABC transporter permease [Halalkalibacter sp. APA_J-10(15)]
MKDGLTLWRERLTVYWNEAIRYLRLIGNSGFLFTVYFLIIIGSYYYSLFLDWLPADFPAIWVYVLVFGHLLTRSGVRTFVKPGDLVFLLPYESQLSGYFQACKWYSYAIQSVFVLVAFVLLSPLYMNYSSYAGPIIYIIGMLIIVKGWNVLTSFEEQRFQHAIERHSHFALRGVINVAFIYLLFSGADLVLILALLALMAILYCFYFAKIANKQTIKWEHLLDVERGMVTFFYRIANAFTDVPQLKNKVRERRYLQWFLHSIKPSPSVYHYLFTRTFLRANDYAGIYIRLVVILAIILAVLPTGWLQLAIMLLFMHMITTQLSTIWYHYDTSLWVDLYPIEQSVKRQALTQLCFRLLLGATAAQVFILLLTSEWLITVTALLIGVFYSYMGSHTLIHKRRKS